MQHVSTPQYSSKEKKLFAALRPLVFWL